MKDLHSVMSSGDAAVGGLGYAMCERARRVFRWLKSCDRLTQSDVSSLAP